MTALPTGPGTPHTSVAVKFIASLDGTSPSVAFGSANYSWARSVAEHFALGLQVPLRLFEDDVRAPEEIYAPLRDRLARRLLPAPGSLPAGRGPIERRRRRRGGNHEDRLAAGRHLGCHCGGRGLALHPDWRSSGSFLLVLLTPVFSPTPYAVLAVIAVAVARFRAGTSTVVTVLADGGLEIPTPLHDRLADAPDRRRRARRRLRARRPDLPIGSPQGRREGANPFLRSRARRE